MKVAIVGAGPAGLYAALLLKRRNPGWTVEVLERNRPDARHGWGVVFSGRTVERLFGSDPETFGTHGEHLVDWDVVEIRHRGEVVRCRGHPFAAVDRHVLLAILREECRRLGVELRFGIEVDAAPDSDLVLAADGVRSTLRGPGFGPAVQHGACRYCWFGTETDFACHTFAFERSPHGAFQAHAYPFASGLGAFIVECHEDAWRRAGLDAAAPDEARAYCEGLFERHLDAPLLTRRDPSWRTFATVRNQRWTHDGVTLLGDAAHTAHFSIGSGTKLALEDALALDAALASEPDPRAALRAYEAARRPPVENLQHAAALSRTLFERIDEVIGEEPIALAYRVLTRSGRIDNAGLRRRDPVFADRADRAFSGQEPGHARGKAPVSWPAR